VSEENKALLRRLYDLVSPAADLSVVDQLVAPDYTDNSPQPNQGPEALKEFIKQVRACLDASIEIHQLVAEGSTVVVQATLHGTHQGSLMGEQPTGKEVTLSYVDVAEIVGGRIKRISHYEADPNMAQQLALTPPAG
jgi:predicted ester cyclase